MSTSRAAPRITICRIPELGEHSAAGAHPFCRRASLNNAAPVDSA